MAKGSILEFDWLLAVLIFVLVILMVYFLYSSGIINPGGFSGANFDWLTNIWG
ncbi:MAG: hypothetical protein HYW25_00935 [Candidatus Aenigmarchaeota archaeon]|nr:hypothetical protein [Candidatus Aenigmarchaeota archaeon]